jgi:hypothetical protein
MPGGTERLAGAARPCRVSFPRLETEDSNVHAVADGSVPLSDTAWRLHEDSNLDCRFRRPDSIPLNYAAGYLDASTGAAPAHGRFADGRVPVSPRRIGLAVPPGIEPRSAGSEPAALPLSGRMIPKKPAPHLMRGGYRFSEEIMRKRKRAAIGQGAVFCPPASAVQARDSSCTSFTL